MTRVSGSPAFLAAHGIFSAGVLPFDHAYALARLVLELGGGPATSIGARAVLATASARAPVAGQAGVDLVAGHLA